MASIYIPSSSGNSGRKWDEFHYSALCDAYTTEFYLAGGHQLISYRQQRSTEVSREDSTRYTTYLQVIQPFLDLAGLLTGVGGCCGVCEPVCCIF